jgi:uroporphyrinogen-III synthase
MQSLIVVTRPAEAGERLVRALRARGHDAHAWPAFELGPAPDPERARQTLARLADFDLAILVSPAAVSAIAALGLEAWPAGTALGAVGSATAAAALAWMPAARGQLVAPESAAASGSEAFWDAWRRSGRVARRVLVLRAEQGREWLAERFAQAGAEVETLAVYSRRERSLGRAEHERVERAIAAHTPFVGVFSSTETVDVLERQLTACPGALDWMHAGTALAMHERIRARLLEVGYRRVELSSADDDAVVARLESLA